MLLPSFFIIDLNKYDSLPELQLPENIYLSYKIADSSIHLIDSFYKKIFLLPQKYPFCLLIELNGHLNKSEADFDKFTDLLISFSFNFNYVKTTCDNPLILFDVKKPEDKKYVSIISEAFKSQGYNDIEPAFIYTDNAPRKDERKNFRFNLQESITSLLPDYISLIKQLSSSDSFFFFFLDNPEKLSEILDILQKAETIIRDDDPQTYYLLKENMSVSAKEHKLRARIGLLQEQIDSLKAYNLFHNSLGTQEKSQIRELQHFYDKEYEILPLWYKRLGHVIKVIMGKRTFRSLFNDNVKKYKD
jgi:hypothetical protein